MGPGAAQSHGSGAAIPQCAGHQSLGLSILVRADRQPGCTPLLASAGHEQQIPDPHGASASCKSHVLNPANSGGVSAAWACVRRVPGSARGNGVLTSLAGAVVHVALGGTGDAQRVQPLGCVPELSWVPWGALARRCAYGAAGLRLGPGCRHVGAASSAAAAVLLFAFFMVSRPDDHAAAAQVPAWPTRWWWRRWGRSSGSTCCSSPHGLIVVLFLASWAVPLVNRARPQARFAWKPVQ
jgi:hypothetical protein